MRHIRAHIPAKRIGLLHRCLSGFFSRSSGYEQASYDPAIPSHSWTNAPRTHINGHRGLLGYAKHILYNYRGVSKYHFPHVPGEIEGTGSTTARRISSGVFVRGLFWLRFALITFWIARRIGKKTKKARHKPGADWATLSRERLCSRSCAFCDFSTCASRMRQIRTPPRHALRAGTRVAASCFFFPPALLAVGRMVFFSPTAPQFRPFRSSHLAHPRLKRLEQDMMLRIVEGRRRKSTASNSLRHETQGTHARQRLPPAPFFRRRDCATARQVRPQQYPKSYTFPEALQQAPFVVHLDNWYAPEPSGRGLEFRTFADVPGCARDPNWRRKYRGWPAFEK